MAHEKFPHIIKSLVYTILPAILLLGILVNLSLVLFNQKDKYLSQTYWQRFPSLKKVYLDSQYANPHPKGFVPDETVYAYAGGAYIHGANPILIVPDAPPLGKYLIGLSALLFNNEHMISLISGVLSLLLLYLLGRQVLESSLLALLPPFFLSFEPLFKNQFVYTPLFDTIQLVFLLLLFYFFNKGLREKKRYVVYLLLAVIFLGMFISTKFFSSGITIVLAMYIVLFAHKDKKRLLMLTLILPVSVLILLASYLRVFAFGYSLSQFLGIQKWIFLYHQGQLVQPFSIWPLLLLNKWHVWWGNNPVLSDAQWQISWPIITVAYFVIGLLYLFKRISHRIEIEILLAWVICYLLVFSIGQITTRYFVILLPVLYIVSIYGLKIVLTKYHLWSSNK